MTPDYQQLLALFRQALSVTASADQVTAAYVRTLAANMGVAEDVTERLVADLCPPVAAPPEKLPQQAVPTAEKISQQTVPQAVKVSQQPVPQAVKVPPHTVAAEPSGAPEATREAPLLLVDLGTKPQPGYHLAPECRVIYPAWEGKLRIKAVLWGLDQEGWHAAPRADRVGAGQWVFHESLYLSVGGKPCPAGDYRINFECHFTDSQKEPDSAWVGTIRFHVTSQQGGKLEIVSDGRGLVNLQGVNFGQLLKPGGGGVRIEARDNALVNMQQLIDEAAAASQAEPEKATALQVQLHPLQDDRDPFDAPPPPLRQARFDLPDGRRVLLYAQDSVILGRNRPFSPQYAHTDIALRLYPRTDERDKLTRQLSEQHLQLSVSGGMLRLEDIRKATSQASFPATIDGRSFRDPLETIGVRPLKYQSALNQQQAVAGLEINVFKEPPSLRQRVLNQLSQQERDWPDQPGWLLDAAGIDAVLIEREHWPDDLNRREAYLLTLGLVALGSDAARCPIRVDGPGVAPVHALLCHWDGQFRLTPVGNAPVNCGGRSVFPGRFAILSPGQTLTLGQTELQFNTAVQYGLE